MKNNYSVTIFCLLVLFFTTSCDFPEHYFKEAPVCQTKINQSAKKLITHLKNQKPSDFRYFFETFKEEGESVKMITNFRNDSVCFDVVILVENWDKLAGMRRTNGKSYPKELYDLEWKIVSIDDKDVIKYIDMHDIID